MNAMAIEAQIKDILTAEITVTYASRTDWNQGIGKAAEIRFYGLSATDRYLGMQEPHLITRIPVALDRADSLQAPDEDWKEVDDESAGGRCHSRGADFIPYSTVSADLDKAVAFLRRFIASIRCPDQPAGLFGLQ